MPNVGRPSRDCHLCRQRRVKCDLRQPECGRCAKSGRQCPGYRDESELVFRVKDAASFAEGTKRERRRRREGITLPSPRESSNCPKFISASGKQVVLPPNEIDALISLSLHGLSQPLAISWPLQNDLPIFFNTLMPRLQRNPAFGFLGFLPDMVAASDHNSPVTLAVLAISCAFRVSRTSNSEAKSQRAMTYGRALTSTNAALRDHALQIKDGTVAAVWLLSLYELIVDPSPPDLHVGPANWNLHTQGMTTLLQLRGTTGFDSLVGRNLFWLMFNSVQIRCFIASHSCPEESIFWLRELEKHLECNEKGSLHMSLYGCHAAALCEKIQKFMDDESSHSVFIAYKLLEEAEGLTAGSYCSSIARPETYETRILSDQTDLPTPNFRAVFVRTFFCSFRLKFLLSVWELLMKIQSLPFDTKPNSLSARIDRIVSEMQTVADELLAATPGIFRSEAKEEQSKNSMSKYWTDGLRLMWPLRLVAFWPVTRPDQRRSAATFLRSICKELGLLQATQDCLTGYKRYHPAAGPFPMAET